MSNVNVKAISDAIAQLVSLKHRFGELGMYETMQAMEVPVTKCGYELAEKIERMTKRNGVSDAG